ncbi:MAG: hypothetical protein P1V18_00640 [Candidatus Gracilibacteria bacterium]|nr:hypothetical protein [Candidatus Gracilibacteria bacterium]
MSDPLSVQDLFSEDHVLTEAVVRSKKLSDPKIYPSDQLIKSGIALVRPFVSLRLKYLSDQERANHYFMGSKEFFPEENHYITSPGLHLISYSIENRPKGHFITIRRNVLEVLVRRIPDKKMPLLLRNTWREMAFDELSGQSIVQEQIEHFQKNLLFQIAQKYRTDYMGLFV